jgi:hypothetical protein
MFEWALRTGICFFLGIRVFSRLDRVFRLAAKHYASSLILWLVSVPLLISGLVFTELSDAWQPESVVKVLLAGVIAQLAMGVVFFIGSKTILHPSRRESAGWKEVISFFVVVGVVRGFSIGYAVDALGVGPTDYVTRVTTAVVLITFSFTVFAYSAQLWRDYRANRIQLLTSIALGERTDALRGIASGEYRPLALGDLEKDVLKAREQTKSALASIRQRVQSRQLDPAGIQEVFDASDSNWRELSHKAWVAGLPNVPKISFLELSRTLASSKPISFIVLSSGPVYGLTRVFDAFDLGTAAIAAVIWLVAVLGIAAATNNLAANYRGKYLDGGVLILLAGFIAIQAVAFLVGLSLLEGVSAQSEIVYVSLVSSSVAFGLGLPPALERSGQVVLAQLEQRLNNTALESLKAQGEMFVLAQRIGGYLHSEVRGDFLRHSLALKESLEKSDYLEAEKILDQLDHLVSSINLEESEQSPIETLLTFLNNWSGVIQISHNLDSIEIKPSLQRSVQALVMEAVNNAVRHGQASWVKVKLSENSNSLELEVDSNSKSLAKNPTQGLGTQSLDRLAPGSWSWELIEDEQVEALLKLKISLAK